MNNAIYHLHIPRTSGVLIRELFKENNPNAFIVAGHKEILDLSDMANANFISGHYGTSPIEHSSSVFSIYREPVERTFSCLKYIWSKFYNQQNFENFLDFFLNDKKLIESVSNQQSKFLTGSINIDKYNNDIKDLKKIVEHNWHIENYKSDIKSVIDYINNSNIKIFNYEDKNVYKKIVESFNLNIPVESFKNVLNKSLDIDKNKYVSYVDKIKEINNVDLELYDYIKK
jgi:hypothetical protein